ncbi:hypothetical protein [Pseudanabaena sp. SR411]|uniref:hypothetical protein n=1 Tax=Pseudanabaena sp. SR411 TaxID=1980935 RepID=UPI00113FDAEB|nr:hypothetical protein [Pseudanabaena sp. SR411]
MSTTIASSIHSLSLALILSSTVSYSAHAEGEESVCVDANGQRQACIQIVGKPKRLTQCQEEEARKNAPECQGMSANSERYELSIRATQADGQIINNLEQSNLAIKINGKSIKPSITTANVTAPLRVVVLLDYSGSMEALDAKDNRKLVGAVNGIKSFIQKLQKNPDVKLAVMPFAAVPNKKACRSFPITDKMLFAENPKNQELLNLNNFYAPNAAVLSTYLETLGNVDNLCLDTSTNLYDALALSLEFLGDRTNKEFYPPIPQDPKSSQGAEIQQPNLFIVMLSDGFNTVPFEKSQPDVCSSAHRDKFTKEYLKNPKYSGIKIFTLGYGKTPNQLQAQYRLTEPAACKHTSDKGTSKNPVPAREFLDENTLKAIATATGGFSDMSGDAEKLAEIFTKIRNAIGGEYKLTYTLDKAERAEAYEISVSALFEGKTLTDTKKDTIGTFAFEILPLGDRLKLWGNVLLLAGIFGGIPFYFWAKSLRKKG